MPSQRLHSAGRTQDAMAGGDVGRGLRSAEVFWPIEGGIVGDAAVRIRPLAARRDACTRPSFVTVSEHFCGLSQRV